jgi:hypothetical protein
MFMKLLKNLPRILLLCALGLNSCGVPEDVDWSGGMKAPDKLQSTLWMQDQVFPPFGTALVIESANSLVFLTFVDYLPDKRGLNYEAISLSRTGMEWGNPVRIKGPIIWKPEFSQRGKRIPLSKDVSFRMFGGCGVVIDNYKYGNVSSVNTNDLKQTIASIQWH